MRWFDGVINSMGMSLSKLREIVKDREDWCATVHRLSKNQLFTSGGQSTGASALATVLPMSIQA